MNLLALSSSGNTWVGFFQHYAKTLEEIEEFFHICLCMINKWTNYNKLNVFKNYITF